MKLLYYNGTTFYWILYLASSGSQAQTFKLKYMFFLWFFNCLFVYWIVKESLQKSTSSSYSLPGLWQYIISFHIYFRINLVHLFHGVFISMNYSIESCELYVIWILILVSCLQYDVGTLVGPYRKLFSMFSVLLRTVLT